MSDRLLGIWDLVRDMIADRTSPDHWYWCRRHEQPEHVGQPVYAVRCPGCRRPVIGKVGPLTSPGSFIHTCGRAVTVTEAEAQVCIRIGPFMSWREASRLDGIPAPIGEPAGIGRKPLGMEVER